MLTTQIKEDMKNGMRAKEALKVETLRGAMAAFTNQLVASNRKPTDELTDAEAVTVIKRLAKQRKEAAEAFETAGRIELAQKERDELVILEAYIPAGVARADIEKVAVAKKEELGVADISGIGKLTGAIMKEFAGNADGNVVKEVIVALFK